VFSVAEAYYGVATAGSQTTNQELRSDILARRERRGFHHGWNTSKVLD